MDRRQELASFGAFALVSPKAGEVHRGQQFPQFRALPRRNGECLMVTPLGGGSIARGTEQIASRPMQLGLEGSLFRRLDNLRGFREVVQPLEGLSKHSTCLGEPQILSRRTSNSPGSTYCSQ